MSRIDLQIASEQEVELLWPAVRAAHLFPKRDVFRAWYAEAPWRVRVDSRQRAVVLDRWRPHLGILAIKGLWASGRDVPGIIEGVRAVARSHDYASVLSPLLHEDGVRRYVEAGMVRHARVVALRVNARAAADAASELPGGVRVRPATAIDLDGVDRVDAACFEPFWAYGPARLEQALAGERLAVAEADAGIIGYTLCTIERGSGTLGRLAVVPEARGRGVGAALLAESLRYMVRAGIATVSLCTQEENAASRSLYARFGLRELPGRLEFLIRDA